MIDDRWGEILDKIQATFNVVDHTNTKDGVEDIEAIIFDGPVGRIKLIRTTRPVIIDKKIIGAHRKGKSKAQYEYIYSDTEKVSRVSAFKEVDGQWQDIEADNFI